MHHRKGLIIITLKTGADVATFKQAAHAKGWRINGSTLHDAIHFVAVPAGKETAACEEAMELPGVAGAELDHQHSLSGD